MSRNTNYILVNGVPEPCHNIVKWSQWYTTADRKIILTGANDEQVEKFGLNDLLAG